jgi:hypothetical protein
MQPDDPLLPGPGPDVLRPAGGLCSELSARAGLPLIGTAGCYRSILAFELGSPWTARLTGSRGSDPSLDEAIARIGAEAAAVRLLALEPREGATATRVLWWSRGEGPVTRYARKQLDVERASLASVLLSLAFDADPADAAEVRDDKGERDILVCTHGARDACCAKFGFPLYRSLVETIRRRGLAVRAWRCSHLGGHRFAPTLLDLPEGRLFGRVREDDLELLLDGGAGLRARLPTIYRGRCAIPEPAQVVERQAWIDEGDAFAAAAIDCDVREVGGGWEVAIRAAKAGPHAARVVRSKAAAVETPASCGRDPEVEAPWEIVA